MLQELDKTLPPYKFYEKILKILFDICSKNLENRKFSLNPGQEEVTWQLARVARDL